jgi:hypothetical protein
MRKSKRLQARSTVSLIDEENDSLVAGHSRPITPSISRPAGVPVERHERDPNRIFWQRAGLGSYNYSGINTPIRSCDAAARWRQALKWYAYYRHCAGCVPGVRWVSVRYSAIGTISGPRNCGNSSFNDTHSAILKTARHAIQASRCCRH